MTGEGFGATGGGGGGSGGVNEIAIEWVDPAVTVTLVDCAGCPVITTVTTYVHAGSPESVKAPDASARALRCRSSTRP